MLIFLLVALFVFRGFTRMLWMPHWMFYRPFGMWYGPYMHRGPHGPMQHRHFR